MTSGKEEIKEKADKNVKQIKGMQFMVTVQDNSRPFAHELLEASPNDPPPVSRQEPLKSQVLNLYLLPLCSQFFVHSGVQQ